MAEELTKKSIRCLYSSPLKRAVETAEYISQRLHLAIRLAPGLREIYQGKLEGLTQEEVQRRYSHWLARWRENPEHLSPPHGEPFRHIRKRVLSSLWRILRQNPEGTICVVTHAVPICLIRQYFTGAPNTQIWSFGIPPGTYIELPVLFR